MATGSATDLHSVARRIRPLIEGNLRLRFPKAFKKNEWLGDFIKKIRDAAQSDALAALKPKLTELEDINNYSKKYHHPGWATEAISGAQLSTYAKRALEFVSGA